MTQLNSNTLFDSDQFDNNLASHSKTIDKITLYRETLNQLDEELFDRRAAAKALE